MKMINNEETIHIGDLIYDVVTKSMWIIINKWHCGHTHDIMYDIAQVIDPSVMVTISEEVVVWMRADYIKRTNSVLANPSQ
tara:strand:+ start:7018 stop:7260 length:243 start_codon:yes stop_codon:yes gene_type:complete